MVCSYPYLLTTAGFNMPHHTPKAALHESTMVEIFTGLHLHGCVPDFTGKKILIFKDKI
jgi:hypothetical protein